MSSGCFGNFLSAAVLITSQQCHCIDRVVFFLVTIAFRTHLSILLNDSLKIKKKFINYIRLL